MASQKEKRKYLPIPPKCHQSDQEKLCRALWATTEALAPNGEPRPRMRWETTEPSTCGKKVDEDWRIIAININNFPSENNGLDKAKLDLLKKTISDSDAQIVGITELGGNEDNIAYHTRLSNVIKK